MAEKWIYRMFGQEFGPVSFEELKKLAELDSISAADEVRCVSSSTWQSASSVSELGLSAEQPASRHEIPVAAAVSPAGTDDWYCMFHGQELGPLAFDEIAAFVEQGQLEASDEVRLGVGGKWRRVGSIGRLMALLPYLAGEHQIPDAKPSPAPVPPTELNKLDPTAVEVATASKSNSADVAAATVTAAAEYAAAIGMVTAAEANLAQAQAAQSAADQSANSQIVWAFAPNVDPAWWGWIGGVEYGPTGFVHILDWAKAGRIQSSDFLKNGIYGQYVPASNVPGLFNAVALMAQAADAVATAQASLDAARAAVPPKPVAQAPKPVDPTPRPVEPAAQSKPEPASAAVPTSPVVTQAAKPVAAATTSAATLPAAPAPTPAAPLPRPAAPSFNSSNGFSSTASSAPRPVATPSRPAPRSSASSSSFSIGDIFAGPGGKWILAVVAVVLLGAVWMFLPESHGKDIERYQNLKALLDDVHSVRAAKKTDFEALKTRASQLTAEYAPILKEEASVNYPAKQSLLWACRDELPRMMAGDLTKESPFERNYATRLKEAAENLHIK
ncbi:MAG: DUF4339 domain-containing protein [Planctomycetes bacterium]|nr:DUF4339 domain-containing protein [Planctomycetota bacterium]